MSSTRWRWPTRFGVDALRYFLLREVTFGQDGSYSAEAIVNRVNAELANSFGNLAQRSLSMIFKNLDGVIPAPGEALEDRALLDRGRARAATRTVPRRFERFAFSAGLEAWMSAVFACNAYVDDAGALGAAQDRSGADGRGARHAGRRDPRAGGRDRAGHSRLGRQAARR